MKKTQLHVEEHADAVADEAADWLVRRQSGLAAHEEEAFARWRATSPEHARAFAELERTWATMNRPRAEGNAAELRHLLDAKAQRRARRRRWTLAVAGTGLAAAAAFAVLFVPVKPERPAAAPQPETAVIMRADRQTLPDGSAAERNAASEFTVNFSPARREVQLVRGEVLFEVAKDVSRPFVVKTGAVEVRAVGTAFSVRQNPHHTDVLVTHGRVAVARTPPVATAIGMDSSSPGAEPVHVDAGNRIIVPADSARAFHVQSLTPPQIAAALRWRERRVEFSGVTIGEAVTFFNRHNARQLHIADPAVAELQISGIFWSNDPDGFARLLEAGMDLQADRTSSNITLRRAK